MTITEPPLQLLFCWLHRCVLVTAGSNATFLTFLAFAAILLPSQEPQYLPGPEKMFGAVEVKYFPDVAAAGLEVLRHEASHEELKRYIKKQQDRQLTEADAELITFELVYLLAEKVCTLPSAQKV